MQCLTCHVLQFICCLLMPILANILFCMAPCRSTMVASRPQSACLQGSHHEIRNGACTSMYATVWDDFACGGWGRRPLPADPTEHSITTFSGMASLKIVTWNVRGLRDKSKQLAALSHLKRMQADISVLVETHITGQMQMALKSSPPRVSYQAPFTNNSRGIAILIAKTVQFQLHSLQSDRQGRFLFLHASVGGLEVLLLAFYVPPPFQFAILKEGVAFMSKHPTVLAIWMGDFNMVIDPLLDRLHSSTTPLARPALTRFGRFLSEFALTVTWRLKYPTTPASHPHRLRCPA